jgi:hypothetical protein
LAMEFRIAAPKFSFNICEENHINLSENLR